MVAAYSTPPAWQTALPPNSNGPAWLTTSTLEASQAVRWPIPKGDPNHFCGVIEYCGVQRSGKNTLATDFLLNKVVPQAPWRRFIGNTDLHLPPPATYQRFDSESLVEEILAIKQRKERDTVIFFDEAGQYLGARGYGSKVQTKCVTFGWQAEKRGILWIITDNLGNSIDIQLALTVHYLIMPHYHHGETHEEDWIDASITDVRGMNSVRSRIYGIHKAQHHFNTLDPVE